MTQAFQSPALQPHTRPDDPVFAGLDFSNNPPVIIGHACRLPEVRGADAMWDVLAGQKCVIGRFSPTMFEPSFFYDPNQTRRGKSYTLAAGQLSDIFHFDPGFFGITPREAQQMDPQQRLMLQTTWEAIESTGLPLNVLQGPRTGVYVGASLFEHMSEFYMDTARADSHFILGNVLSIIANRVSSQFDFGGPSFTLDTACSSGLYALNYACKDLRDGTIDTAIVGAVHLVRTPGGFVGFSQARMLSPTGLCHAFDAAADGYVRSEGCIVLVLQREQTAHQNLAPIHARILAGGVNSDGAQSPLVVPSQKRQTKLMDMVLGHSGLDPDDLDFIEAHGTGTQVGDHAEAHSIGSSFGMLRRKPLLIGSAKTNFGHPEPVAGLMGLLKTVLAFKHRALPASLHFNTPNPAIAFDDLNIKVNTALTPLDTDRPLCAGINSFGFGGTNVHMLVDDGRGSAAPKYHASAALPPNQAPPYMLLSAASQTGLQHLAGRWVDHLAKTPPEDHPALMAALAHSRTALSHRLALPLDEALISRLRACAGGQAIADERTVFEADAGRDSPRTIFMFAGNGAQFTGMCRPQYHHDPLFRQHFDACAALFDTHGVSGLTDLLLDDALDAKLHRPLVAQPVLFACQVALARTLMQGGLMPDAVIGHSVGEIAALHIGGVLGLEDAIHIITSRSRAFEGLIGQGTMAVIGAAEKTVEQALVQLEDQNLVIAAVNSPKSVTISGPAGAIDRLAKMQFNGKRLPLIRLGIEVPYHSPAVEPLYDRFMQDIAHVTYHPARIPIGATSLGKMMGKYECNGDYLWKNARACVHFSDTVLALATDHKTGAGHMRFVEISPRPLFAANLRDISRLSGRNISHFAAIPDPAAPYMGQSAQMARAWCAGLPVDITALCGTKTAPAGDLPPYPFDEQYHRAEISHDSLDAWGRSHYRPLIGAQIEPQFPYWVHDLYPKVPDWLEDHRVGGNVVMPAAGILEMMLEAATRHMPQGIVEIRQLDIARPLILEDTGTRVRTMIDMSTNTISIEARARLTPDPWNLIARAGLRRYDGAVPQGSPLPPMTGAHNLDDTYDFLARHGLHYGENFRRLDKTNAADKDIWVTLAPALQPDLMAELMLDPTALDGVFHAIALLAQGSDRGSDQTQSTPIPPAMREAMANGAALLPIRFGTVRLFMPKAAPHFARMRFDAIRPRSLVITIDLFDEAGRIIAQIIEAEFALARLEAARPIPATAWDMRKIRLSAPNLNSPPSPKPDMTPVLARHGFQATAPKSPLTAPLAALRKASVAGHDTDKHLRILLNEAPDLINDLRILLARARGEPAYDAAMAGHSRKILWQKGRDILIDMITQWPATARLNVLLSGLPDMTIVNELVKNPRIDHLALGHGNPDAFSFLQMILPDDRKPLLHKLPQNTSSDDVTFDLILAFDDACQNADELPARLAPEGRIFLLDYPDLMPAHTPDAPLWPHHACHQGNSLPLRLRWQDRDPEPRPAEATAAPVIFDFVPSPYDLIARLWADLTPSEPPKTKGKNQSPVTVLALIQKTGQSADEAIADYLMTLRPLLQTGCNLTLVHMRTGSRPHFDLLTAALQSAVSTLANEYGEQTFRLIAVDRLDRPDLAAILKTALHWHAGEPVLWLEDDGIYAPRFMPRTDHGPQVLHNSRLICENPGRPESLVWREAPRPAPRAREIEIEVKATGLNFRDVMWARGLLPERMLSDGAIGAGLGMECAGIVSRVPKGSKLRVGDPVMGFAPQSFANYITMREDEAILLPPQVDTVTAAALPVVFVTAWYALAKVARLEKGETLLVHGATGGVGIAALEIARHLGARVIATAGSPEKRALALAMGAEAVFDSRSLTFHEEVRRHTKGRGVDVVLNSLFGEAMQLSVECLAPFGRFIELGKRDYVAGTRLDLRPFSANLSYFGVDLDQIQGARPEWVRAAMQEVIMLFAKGDLKPLPVTRFDAQNTLEAFRYMLQSTQIGKVVITPPPLAPTPLAPAASPKPAKIKDSWVIFGGTGGVGLAVARHLHQQGAARIHLVSRSGELPFDGPKELQKWALETPAISIHRTDMADEGQMRALFDKIREKGEKISGVIHAAMYLRDRLVRDLDTHETRQTLRSKLGGALVLDRVLQTGPQPDHVIFFSSIAALLGNPGQISYSAANAAMAKLAERRHNAGLPAVCIGFGAIEDAGYLSRNPALAGRMRKLGGFRMITMNEVLAQLDRVIHHPGGQNYYYAAIDWNEFAGGLPALKSQIYRTIIPPSAFEMRLSKHNPDELRALDWPAALERIEQELRQIIGTIMRIAPDQLDPRRPLSNFGIDSLMAMELKMEIEARFGSNFPVFSLSDDLTLARLSVNILEKIHELGPNEQG